MDMSFTPEETAFRDDIRAFLKAELDPALARKVRLHHDLTKAEMEGWHAKLQSRGWLAGNWPKEFGGAGWTAIQRHIFEEESARAHAPRIVPFGIAMLGPVLQKFGSKEQQDYWLPRILNGDDWWCQGYSEPNAGSDLASLRTRAVRDGDHYVLNGQKAWTSYGHVASHCFVLARTSDEAKRQQGISLFLLDMKTPGITIRPVATMDEKHHTNEMFLDDVRVPVENLVGEEGRGWEYGKVLLDRERMVTASVAVFLIQTVKAIRDAASRHTIGGVSLLDKPDFKDKLAQYEIEVIALQTMVLRVMADASAGVDSGPLGSMIKLRWSQLLQAGTALWIAALGPKAAHFAALDHASVLPTDMPYAMQGVLHSRVTSIYGGSSEIQHNIIAQRALGLKG